MMKLDVGWNSLLYDYSDRLLKFVVNAQTNTLPTPDNLRRWGLKRNVACGLCGRNEVTLSHVWGVVIGFEGRKIKTLERTGTRGAIITSSTCFQGQLKNR